MPVFPPATASRENPRQTAIFRCNPQKNGKIPRNMANLMQNPHKSCGNQAFGLDFP
jgi:hypothetical protein